MFSHSRLSSFEKCPKQFYFRYVLRLPAETESVEAFLGKRVHEVLERLYLVVREGRVPSLAQVVRRFHANWEEAFQAERVRIVRNELDPAHYREVGVRSLRNFYRRYYPFDGEETLGIEERVSFALDAAGTYRMQGVIDRLVRARDGAVEIHDYKTGRRVPPQRALDEDRQLALYQLGLAARLDGAPEVRLVWHYLAVDQMRVSRRNAEQLEALRERTIGLIDSIQGEQRFEPRPGPLCSWCEYRERCPIFASSLAEARPVASAAPGAERPLPRTAPPPVAVPA
ncbi:MAG TPA: PD-(D/E)XK nuclease family protein, partial [Myxococcota bacterium]|nr:PD-(D/E)XK nuclease family protein [Myxococcota bacterium]